MTRALRLEYNGPGKGFRLIAFDSSKWIVLESHLGAAEVLELIAQGASALRECGGDWGSRVGSLLRLVGGSKR
jgi:hypothetical protein